MRSHSRTIRVLAVLAALSLGIGCAEAKSPSAARSSELATGTHTATVEGVPIVYHVAGRGPVVLVHPGGPGIEWKYMRMPEVEKVATVVYLEPVGTGASGRLADPHGYTIYRYVSAIDGVR